MTQMLGLIDYVVWVLLLIMSLVIGIYFGFFDKSVHKNVVEGSENVEFLLGSRKMGSVPVACSLMASFFSAITLLGTPNEIYQYGIMYGFIGIGYIFTILISAFLFVPVFYNLQITSSYQYLALRFSKLNQVFGALAFIFQMVPYLGIVLYCPCLALNVVVDVNIWIVITSMAVICTVYTTMGGIKAVVWTDVLQLSMMFVGMIGIIIKGSIDAGGIKNVMVTSYYNERLDLNFSFDPRTRHTIWSAIIGGSFLWCGIYSINQTMIQRALCISSLKQAKLAYFLNIFGMNALLIIVLMCGFVIFHTFYGCDPLITKEITKSDQIVPYYVSKFLLQYPGIGGIFVAAIFSGSLSTISSGLNSLAAVTLYDVIMLKFKHIDGRKASVITKSLVVIYGVLTLLFAYLSSLTSKLMEAAQGLFGMLSGPLFGVFTLGMFFPFANYKGAIVGHLVSQVLILWIGFSVYAQHIKHPKLSLNNYNCTGKGNFSRPTDIFITSMGQPIQGIQNLYAVSYQWYTIIGWFITLLVGIPISLLTKSLKNEKVQSKYISPPFQRLWHNYLTDSNLDNDLKPIRFKIPLDEIELKD